MSVNNNLTKYTQTTRATTNIIFESFPFLVVAPMFIGCASWLAGRLAGWLAGLVGWLAVWLAAQIHDYTAQQDLHHEDASKQQPDEVHTNDKGDYEHHLRFVSLSGCGTHVHWLG